jgi:hypothetical protein
LEQHDIHVRSGLPATTEIFPRLSCAPIAFVPTLSQDSDAILEPNEFVSITQHDAETNAAQAFLTVLENGQRFDHLVYQSFAMKYVSGTFIHHSVRGRIPDAVCCPVSARSGYATHMLHEFITIGKGHAFTISRSQSGCKNSDRLNLTDCS